MIINLLINVILVVFNQRFSLGGLLKPVTLADLPYIGDEVSSILTAVILKWNAFMATFPYAETGWHIFLWVILPFEAVMLVAKFVLGSRVPAHNVN